MGYFAGEVVPPIVEYYAELLVRPRNSPRSDPAGALLRRALPALAVVGARRAGPQRAQRDRDGALGHRRQGGRQARPRTARRRRPRAPAALRARRHGRLAGPEDRRPGEALCRARLQRAEDRHRDDRPTGPRPTPSRPRPMATGTRRDGAAGRRRAREVRALREAVGPDIEIATDSHAVQVRGPWGRRDALAIAQAIEEFDLLFYEEPLRYDDPDGYAELRRQTRIPIAGGECLTGVGEFQRLVRPRRAGHRPAGRDARRRDRAVPRRREGGRRAPRRDDRPHRCRGRARASWPTFTSRSRARTRVSSSTRSRPTTSAPRCSRSRSG